MAAVANVAINVDSRGAVGKLRQVADRSKELEKAAQGASTAVSKTGRELKTAANGMQYFIDATGRARKANGQFVTTAEAAAAGLDKQGRSASLASNGLNRLAKGLLGAAAGFATVGTAAALASQAIQSAISRTESERRLKILAASYGEVAEIQNVAASSSRLFGQSQTETNQAIASAYARLRPLGISLQDISSTYNGFNTAARLSGATAQESSAAFTQLAQALGSGVLRGDEFNSIAEQAPGLLQAISKELNVGVGELRDYAQEGKITSDVVINALKAIEKEGASPLAEAMGGPEQKLKDLQNETDNLRAEIGKLALPALIQVVSELTGVIKTASDNTKIFSQVMNGLGKEFQFILGPLASFYEYIGGIPGIISNSVDALFSMFGPLKQLAQLIAFASGKMLGPELQRLQGIGAYTGMADAPEDVRKALAEPKLPVRPVSSDRNGRSKKQLKEQKDLSDAMYALELKRQDIRFQNNELLKIQVDKEVALQKILEGELQPRERLVAITNTENNAIEKAAQLMAPIIEGVEELQNGATEAGKAFAQLYIDADNAQLAEKAKELDGLYRSIGDTITTSIVDSLTAAVDGTKSLAEVASSTLRSVASILLKFGLNTLTSGLAGNDGVGFFSKLFGGGRASGGTVRGGTSYLVGERGPELFTPNRSGSIAPSGSIGGATVVVNVDASGTQAQGNNQSAKQLGNAIGAAVQAELIKQKRPGGLLAS